MGENILVIGVGIGGLCVVLVFVFVGYYVMFLEWDGMLLNGDVDEVF